MKYISIFKVVFKKSSFKKCLRSHLNESNLIAKPLLCAIFVWFILDGFLVHVEGNVSVKIAASSVTKQALHGRKTR